MPYVIIYQCFPVRLFKFPLTAKTPEKQPAKKLSKYEQLIANLNKASQELKEATNKAIETLDAHAEKVENIHQEAMSK